MSVPSFPLVWPELPFVEATLDLVPRQSLGAAPGWDFAADRAQPQWVGRFGTRGLSNAEIGVARATFGALRGAVRQFLLHDPLREWPLAYMPGGWPIGMLRADGSDWDGTAVLRDISDSAVWTRDLAEIWSLPGGFVFSPGDYVSFPFGTDQYSLHRVLDPEPVTASDDGKAQLWLEPEIPAALGAGGSAILWRAPAKWVLDPNQRPAIPVSGTGGARPAACSFQALSTLR